MVNPHIVITTIFHPSRAVKLYSQIEDIQLIVVGDRKTPVDWACNGTRFLSIDEQKTSGHALARILPENHYSRKMLGYIQAMHNGAEVIVDTDDDNIPKENWHFPNFQGEFQITSQDLDFINIYRYYSDMKIWPRGLPLDCINQEPAGAENGEDFARQEVKVGVWQGLADGDPDVDAIYRLGFTNAIVFQDRNEHDYLKDFESEIPCFLHGHQIIETVEASIRTDYSMGDNLYEAYQALCKIGIVKSEEMEVLSAWLQALPQPV